MRNHSCLFQRELSKVQGTGREYHALRIFHTIRANELVPKLKNLIPNFVNLEPYTVPALPTAEKRRTVRAPMRGRPRPTAAPAPRLSRNISSDNNKPRSQWLRRRAQRPKEQEQGKKRARFEGMDDSYRGMQVRFALLSANVALVGVVAIRDDGAAG